MTTKTFQKLKFDYGLGEQEIEVLRLLAEGNNIDKIAKIRCRSVHTIDSQRRKIYSKLKVKNGLHLIIKAIQLGVVDVHSIELPVIERI